MRAIAAAALMTLAVPADAQAQELPEWLAGCWQMQDGERWSDECWMSPRGDVMLGTGRSGTGARLSTWEAMQITIEPAEARRDAEPTMTFWASPNGGGRAPFAWAPNELPGVTFVNPANDYPQRIRYWREGNLLRAEISLADGSEATRWTFVPAGDE
jgi:hypothetical protein